MIVPDSHFVPSKQQVAVRCDRCSIGNLDGVSVAQGMRRVVEPLPIRRLRTELTFLANFGTQQHCRKNGLREAKLDAVLGTS